VKIHNEIVIAAPIDVAWVALNDMPRVARCAPGADLLEQRDDGACVGTIGVRLGPVALKFKGVVEFIERDDATNRVVAKAKGAEEKARGSATADVVFTLTRVDAGTKIVVDSDITLAGFIAQYGRGAALIQGTAQALMADFAKNLEADLNGGGEANAGEISAAKLMARGVSNAVAGMFKKEGG
jgi:carbon monoxide dehydrogenase subunit G